MTAPRLGARRVALGVFVAIEAFAFVFYMLLGRFAWFSQDEWDFLAGRSAGDLGDLFRPKNEHWTTLPILVFRLLWWLFGLRTYVPYLVLVVTLHLVVAALLRAVMRRAYVGPWVSTATASAFALFGTGYFNIEYAFQITFLGSLAFGLAYLLLADHDGPVDRRDWIGVLAGLAGLACSGVGLVMAAVVVVAVLVRRGWATASFHAGSLAGAYLLWLFVIGYKGSRAAPGSNFTQTIRFITRELRGTFGALGQVPGVGLALAVMMIVGLAIAWAPLRGRTLRERVAMPAALLLGAASFLLITAISRGAPFAASTPPGPASRYRYIVAAMVVPALAVAADAIGRRWRVLAPIVLALVLIGVPGNLRIAADRAPDWREYKLVVLSTLHLPISPELPNWVIPERAFNPWLTVGWLRAGVASGRVPRARPMKMTPAFIAARSLDLALQPAPSERLGSCRRFSPGTTRVLTRDEPFAFRSGDVSVVYQVPGGTASSSRRLKPGTYVAVAGPLVLRVAPAAPEDAVVCG
jgi:hypothetical protein